MTTDSLIDCIVNKGIFYIESELPVDNCKGLYFDNTIVIDKKINTSNEKRCILAEELGHYETSAGNILDDSIVSAKKEKIARNWGYEKLVPVDRFIAAYEYGCKNRYEIADFLNVTEEFLEDAIKHYSEKYGLYKKINEYVVYFEPLGVMKGFKN